MVYSKEYAEFNEEQSLDWYSVSNILISSNFFHKPYKLLKSLW